VWILLLYVNSAHAIYSGQSFCLWLMNILKYCSISWLTHSVCPSVCGWYAVDNLVLIPRISFSSFMNSAANCGPLSDSAVSGKSWSFQTWSPKGVARPLAEVVVDIGIICAYFVWQQHVMNNGSYPCASGRPVIKSVVISFQGCVVASLGLSFPAGFSGKDFIRWHQSHLDT